MSTKSILVSILAGVTVGSVTTFLFTRKKRDIISAYKNADGHLVESERIPTGCAIWVNKRLTFVSPTPAYQNAETKSVFVNDSAGNKWILDGLSWKPFK